MRHITVIFLLVLSLPVFTQTKQEVTSKIERVIVFTNGAQVSRAAKTTISTGKTELVFKDISPNIDKQSIQVKGDGAFTILSVTHQMNYLKLQEVTQEIIDLEKQRNQLTDDITYQTALLNVYKQEQSLMEKNQSIGGSNVGVSTENLKSAADFQRTRLTEIYTRQNEISKAIKEFNESLAKVNAQLMALNARKEKPTSEIHVIVSATAGVSGKFDISYYVKDAGWFANYDLRVKDVSSPVDIYYKANVYQGSGEDWKDIRITLSNGNPNESGVAPEPQAWRLYYGNAVYDYGQLNNYTNSTIFEVRGRITDNQGEAIPWATIQVKGTTVGTSTDIDGFYTLKLPAGSNYLIVKYIGYNDIEMPITSGVINLTMKESTQLLQEVTINSSAGVVAMDAVSISSYRSKNVDIKSIPVAATIQYKPTTFTYEIEEPYSIPNDGKVYTIDIQALEVPALYEYVSTPKIDPDVFLTASITEWQDLNLLPGEANLFFEGAYLGKTVLDVMHAKDTLAISLGRDKSVVIQRNKLKEFTQRQFIGSNKKETYAYEIVIRNNKKQAINLTVKDQFPIATENDMEVEQIDHSGGKVDENTQVITWTFSLEPKAEKRLALKYAVKYPKDKTLVLE